MTTSAATDVLLERARAWAAEDPDDATRTELEQIIADVAGGADSADLADRFAGTLEFGTAGLRGAVGAGPNRMNRVVVIRAAAGLAAYLNEQGATGPVVVGFDARHRSDDFARDTAEVMSGAGFKVWVMPRPLPTPVVAFAIRELGCAAGVMVTASHNPPQDNGYKVYLGDGSQIVPPADAGIAARIDAVGALRGRARAAPRRDRARRAHRRPLPRHDRRARRGRAAGPRPRLHAAARRRRHVGAPGARDRRASARRGWSSSRSSPTRTSRRWRSPTRRSRARWTSRWRSPRSTTPTWSSPTTRMPTAAPPPCRPAHGWRMLRGDEVGALLAHHLMARGRTGTFATSIVSSTPARARWRRAAGQPYVETLTGFKWIGRVPGLAFGYEEALGYCCDPDHVKDKDGVSALLLLCELAAADQGGRAAPWSTCSTTSRSQHGLHATDQVSVRVADLSLIADAMERLRAAPPSELGGLAVERVDDLALGSADLPPTDGLRFHLAEGARVVVRPSGTEPKLKCYLEVVVPVDAEAGVDAARISAAARLDALKRDIAASRSGLCELSRRAIATTKKAAVATSAAISGQASSRRTSRASSSASGENRLTPWRIRASLTSSRSRISTKSA